MVTSDAFDVLIVGGGPVGWACALAVQHALVRGARVGVIDPNSLAPENPSNRDNDAPISARVYTVTEDNLSWLATHNIAPIAARSANVHNIIVHTQDGAVGLNISDRDARAERLACVVEHDWIAEALRHAALSRGVHAVTARAVTSDVLDGTRYVELDDQSMRSAALVVIAQGGASGLTAQVGIDTLHRDYERFGVIANFACDAPHLGAAKQWFLRDQSVLALLPLPDHLAQHAVSMVWSVDESRRDTLCTMSADELCAEVASASGVTIKGLTSPAQAFPLSLARTADPVGPRALVVGDSAHAIHPLAGQGVNLGLADAQALGNALAQAEVVGNDAGHPLLLARYRRERYGATLAMQATTDLLARIYNQDSPALSHTISDLGMRVLGRVPAFRRIVSSVAG